MSGSALVAASGEVACPPPPERASGAAQVADSLEEHSRGLSIGVAVDERPRTIGLIAMPEFGITRDADSFRRVRTKRSLNACAIPTSSGR